MNTAIDRKNRHSLLFLRPQDLKGLITMAEAIEAVEQGYREAEDFPIVNAPRRRVHSPDGVRVSNFPGGIPGLGVIGSLINPLGLLVPLVSAGSGDKNPCVAAIAARDTGAAGGETAPEAAPEEADTSPIKKIGDAIRGIGAGIGKGLKSLFGQ